MERSGAGKKAKRELVEFDRLKKESQDEKTSLWKGDRGTYIFESTGMVEAKKPIRRVYLNRTYMTGLFRSRKPEEFLGDLKEPEGKKYLLFRLLGTDKLIIYQRL